MKTLIYCCSVYQLFNAIHIRMHILKDDDVDILLSDILPDQNGLAERIRKSGLFCKVYTSNGKFIVHQQYKQTRLSIYGYRIFPSLLLKKANLIINKVYDRFYFATFDDFISYVFLRLHWLNKKLEVCCYEDGGVTYIRTFQSCNSVEERLYHWLGILPLGMIKVPLMVYVPELVTFDCGTSIVSMPRIDLKDEAFRNAVNNVFGFSGATIPDCKGIFFEESFLGAGLKNNDAELIELSNQLFKGKLLLKPHPGNPYNRFEKSGIKILHSKIPWEIYCLNVDLCGKILITVNSNAAISPHILYKNAPKTILLFNLLVGESFLRGKPEYDAYYLKILQMFPDEIMAPKTQEELEYLIKKLQ